MKVYLQRYYGDKSQASEGCSNIHVQPEFVSMSFFGCREPYGVAPEFDESKAHLRSIMNVTVPLCQDINTRVIQKRVL